MKCCAVAAGKLNFLHSLGDIGFYLNDGSIESVCLLLNKQKNLADFIGRKCVGRLAYA